METSAFLFKIQRQGCSSPHIHNSDGKDSALQKDQPRCHFVKRNFHYWQVLLVITPQSSWGQELKSSLMLPFPDSWTISSAKRLLGNVLPARLTIKIWKYYQISLSNTLFVKKKERKKNINTLSHATSGERLATNFHGNFRKLIQNEDLKTSHGEKHSAFLFFPTKNIIKSFVNSWNRWACLQCSKQSHSILEAKIIFIYSIFIIWLFWLYHSKPSHLIPFTSRCFCCFPSVGDSEGGMQAAKYW